MILSLGRLRISYYQAFLTAQTRGSPEGWGSQGSSGLGLKWGSPLSTPLHPLTSCPRLLTGLLLGLALPKLLSHTEGHPTKTQ